EETEISLEFGPLLVAANTRNEDAFPRVGRAERVQEAAGVIIAQLVDLHAEALEERLLKNELETWLDLRVDHTRCSIRGTIESESNAGDATCRKWLHQSGLEGKGVGGRARREQTWLEQSRCCQATRGFAAVPHQRCRPLGVKLGQR